MLEVRIKKEPWYDGELDDVECENFDTNAVFRLTEESTSTDAIKMFVKALEVEGYMPQSIVRSLYDVGEYMADTLHTEFKGVDDECEDYGTYERIED